MVRYFLVNRFSKNSKNKGFVSAEHQNRVNFYPEFLHNHPNFVRDAFDSKITLLFLAK